MVEVVRRWSSGVSGLFDLDTQSRSLDPLRQLSKGGVHIGWRFGKYILGSLVVSLRTFSNLHSCSDSTRYGRLALYCVDSVVVW